MRLEGRPTEREGVAGCQGHVTVYRLQPDTRIKGAVQPARLLAYDDNDFYLSYEGAPLCAAETNSELRTELGIRSITVHRGDWLTDESQQN